MKKLRIEKLSIGSLMTTGTAFLLNPLTALAASDDPFDTSFITQAAPENFEELEDSLRNAGAALYRLGMLGGVIIAMIGIIIVAYQLLAGDSMMKRQAKYNLIYIIGGILLLAGGIGMIGKFVAVGKGLFTNG